MNVWGWFLGSFLNGVYLQRKFAPVRVNSSLTSLFPSRRELNRKMKCGVAATESQPMHWTFFFKC